MLPLRRLLLVYGLISLATFLATGAYMHFVHGHLAGYELAERLFYRSRHIYILAAALVQLGIGAYIDPRSGPLSRRAQYAGTVLLVLATPLLLAAFCLEHGAEGLRSPLSAYGLYALGAGVFAHLVAGASRKGDT